MDCPAELVPGESGSFLATANGDSTMRRISWDWGDGESSEGERTTHRYRTGGAYVVTATLSGRYNNDIDTCVVTVIPMGEAPHITACRVSLGVAAPDEPVIIDVGVVPDTGGTISLSVDWGDGNSANVDALPAVHRYGESGTYTITATATSPFGSDTCEQTVTIAA